MYWVFYTSEDGDTSFQVLNRNELQLRLNENYWGETEQVRFLAINKSMGDVHILPTHAGVIIIKGELVVPKAKKFVTTWDV